MGLGVNRAILTVGLQVAVKPAIWKGETELPEKSGGLNWSVQHYLEVYLPEFESPKFVAGVD